MCREYPEFARTDREQYRGLTEIEMGPLTLAVEPSPILQTSLEVLRDLGMSDGAIAEYFRRFNDGIVDVQRFRSWTTEARAQVVERSRNAEFQLKPPNRAPTDLEPVAGLGRQEAER